jgi:hypothetical protein
MRAKERLLLKKVLKIIPRKKRVGTMRMTEMHVLGI